MDLYQRSTNTTFSISAEYWQYVVRTVGWSPPEDFGVSEESGKDLAQAIRATSVPPPDYIWFSENWKAFMDDLARLAETAPFEMQVPLQEWQWAR